VTRAVSCTLALVLSAAVALAQDRPQALSSYDRASSLAMLAQVKQDLKDNYYDRAFGGRDLDEIFAEAEQRLKQASSVNETTGIIVSAVMELNDSHTMFLPPGRRTKVTYGWQAAMVGDVPYVIKVTHGSDAEKKGLAVGDRILGWNRFEPTRDNLFQIQYLYDVVRPQAMQHLTIRKPDGSEKAIDVESKLEPQPVMDVVQILEMLMDSPDPDQDRAVMVGNVLVWRYTGFGDPKAIDRVMKKARDAKSLVLDLRGNGGGVLDALRNMTAHLFDRDVLIGTEKTRKGDEAVRAKGRKDAFTGGLVVLVDSRSGSAAEMLARMVEIEKRGRVLGDRTAGAVMAGRVFPHSVGMDRVAFYGMYVTVGAVQMSDGSRLERTGVTPDDVVLPTATDLATKQDPVLARALSLLGATVTPDAAGRLYR
jgi:C-terminal processing protease CtpA/Prc